MGKLELNEQSDLEFGLEIQGTIEKAQQIRFVIEGPDFSVMCKCTEDKGNFTAHIPKLKGILPSGVYESRLEIVVNNTLFTPLQESIEFNPLIDIGVTKKELRPIKEGVKVTVKTPMVSEEVKTTKKDEVIKTVIAEGFEIVQMKGFEVLKKDGKYFGILNENNVVKSKTGHTTLSALVEDLSK